MYKNLFDQLPTDIIYYEIFPYLDYNSRVCANLLLPLKDRLRTPLRKDSVLEFSILQATKIITPILKKFNHPSTTRAYRTRLILKIWRTLVNYPILVQYNQRYRDMSKIKTEEFYEILDTDANEFSKYTTKKLKELLKNYLLFLERHPFIREINFAKNENWTATNTVY
jgi:hypothetical protein